MSLVCYSLAPTSFVKFEGDVIKRCSWACPCSFISYNNNSVRSTALKMNTFIRNKPSAVAKQTNQESFTESSTLSMDWEDEEEVEDTGLPWAGAVVYKRNAYVTHVEYCTTLERLGLEKISTDVSKAKASAMGLRVTKDVKDYPHGTPVQISVDVTRKKHKLRLDGILRTVIALGCNRCGEAAAESIFSNFSLLLSEVPIEEPDVIDIGFNFGNNESKSFIAEEDEDDLIDWDDRLYFPPEVTEIDISKHLRDIVHLEITINAVCDPNCKGICLKCGTNLNTRNCNCGEEMVEEKGTGPLGNLREQMEQKRVQSK